MIIKSPYPYSGNKASILPVIQRLMPRKINKFIEPFFGSGIMIVNITANKYIVNDKFEHLLKMYKYLMNIDFKELEKEIKSIIKKYGLVTRIYDNKSYTNKEMVSLNKESFYKLREDYNKNPSMIKYYMLYLFSYNNYMSFNKKGDIRCTAGNSGWNLMNKERLLTYKNRYNLIKDRLTIHNKDFYDFLTGIKYQKNDLIYLDPPYFVTNTQYNILWKEKDEIKLYKLLDKINSKSIKFMLSNIIEYKGKTNKYLKEFSKRYKIIEVKNQYKNTKYKVSNIKEIILINY